MTILETIVKVKITEVADLKEKVPLYVLEKIVNDLPPTRNFRDAISSKDCSIIAEVKRKSPSKGELVADFDPVRIASVYTENGAAAISILTDVEFFGGDKAYISAIKKTVGIPLLRKDFVINPYQIYETRLIGADAILLITAILTEKQLSEFIHLSETLGLAPLVDVHDRADLEKALACGAKIIGINNRDLKTFVTDVKTSMDLIALMPKDKIVVSESGISTAADMKYLSDLGVDAVLVGEVLMRAESISEKINELRSF